MNNRVKKFILTILVGIVLILPNISQAKNTWEYPRLANYFLDSYLHPDEGKLLASWDVLILAANAQEWRPDVFEAIRRENPDVIILAYISATGVTDSPTSEDFPRFTSLGSDQIPDEWWLKSSTNERLGYWPGAKMLNVSNQGPVASSNAVDSTKSNRRWNEWLPEFIADQIYSTGYWDGIFLDETFAYVNWINGGDIDLDRNGIQDTPEEINAMWQVGVNEITKNLRQRLGENAYIVVNGSSNYTTNTNGRMHENVFDEYGSWASEMSSYIQTYNLSMYSPKLSLINSNTNNTGTINNQLALFGFTSALLGDGFFSYDHGDQKHMNIWWLPEYDISLGQPLGSAINIIGEESSGFGPGLWRRDFTNGTVLVNSTDGTIHYDISYSNLKKQGELKAFSGTIITRDEFIQVKPAQPLEQTKSEDIIKEPTPVEISNETKSENTTPIQQGSETYQQPLYQDHPPIDLNLDVGESFIQENMIDVKVTSIEAHTMEIEEPVVISEKEDFFGRFFHEHAFVSEFLENIKLFFGLIKQLFER